MRNGIKCVNDWTTVPRVVNSDNSLVNMDWPCPGGEGEGTTCLIIKWDQNDPSFLVSFMF